MSEIAHALQGVSVALDGRSLRNLGIGVSRYAVGLIDLLEQAGTDITILSDAPLELDEQHQHLRVVVLEDSRRFRWEQKVLRSHLRENNYDIYFATNNSGLPAFYRGSTHLAVIVHDLIPLLFWRQYLAPNPRKGLRYVLSQSIAVRKADSIFTVSVASQQAIKRMFFRDAVVAPPAIHEAAPLPAAHVSKTPYFIYVGGYDWRKNAQNVVRAFAKLRSSSNLAIKLVMTGSPTPLVLDEIKRQGLTKYVELPGIVPEAQKWALLRGAVASVYPSSYEGFGLPLVESFRADIPIISSDSGALKEVGGPAIVQVDPTSATDISNKMHWCLDKAFRNEHIELGRMQLAHLLTTTSHNAIVDHLRGIPGTQITANTA